MTANCRARDTAGMAILCPQGPAVPQRQSARRAMSSAGQSSQIRPHPPWTA